jgi:hypothetical protein
VKQKGAAIKSTLQAIERLHGEESLARVKGALAPAILAQIEPRVLTVAWYPIEVSAAVHLAIRDVIGQGDWSASRAIGVEAARIDFNGIYRVFLRSLQYDTIWERTQRAWVNYNSQGTARWEERAPGTAQGMVTGVTGFNVGVWNAVAGRLESLLHMSGARGATIDVHDATSTSCSFDAMWLE